MMALLRLGQGIFALVIFRIIIGCIKKFDSENGLPEGLSWKMIFLTFFSGGLIVPESIVQSLLLITFISYLASMAYTDFYTMQVYSLFYVLAAVPGYMWLLGTGSWFAIKVALIYIGFVLIAFWVFKGFGGGDAEVFIAATPYITLLAQRMEQSVVLVLILFMLLALAYSVLGCVVKSIRTRKWVMKSAMVPYIYGAAVCMVILDNLL